MPADYPPLIFLHEVGALAPPRPALAQPSLFDEPPPPPPGGPIALPPPCSAAETELVTGLLVALLEALQGRRAVAQLAGWLTESALTEVVRHRTPQRRGTPTLRLLGVRAQAVDVGAGRSLEVSARVGQGSTSRALALRLDQRRGRWRCNAVDFGPLPEEGRVSSSRGIA